MNTASQTNQLTLLYDIGLVDPKACLFSRNSNGFLGLEFNGTTYKRVQLSRSLPHSEPFRYICIADMEGNEIGIILNVEELNAKSAELVRSELESRYYCPEITEITSVKEKMGMFYFDVKIGSHKKLFTVKDVSKNIKKHPDGTIRLYDVDGNRFFIRNIERFDSKSRRKIEPYLY